MFDRKILKNRAKTVLSRSFPTSLLACFLVSLAGSGGAGISTRQLEGLNLANMSNLRIAAIFAVAGLLVIAGLAFLILVTSPLSVGLKYFMLRAADGDVRIENLLYPFKNGYKNIIWVQFVKNLYIILWSLVGLIPLIIGLWKFGLYEKIQELTANMNGESLLPAFTLLAIMSLLSVVTLIFSVPGLIKELQYSMVEYILADDPYMPRSKAIGKSKEMMVGNKWALVKLAFSFAGWYIAANMFCCLGSIVLRPYIEATYAQLYLELSGQNKDYSDYTNPQPNNPFDGFSGFGGF